MSPSSSSGSSVWNAFSVGVPAGIISQRTRGWPSLPASSTSDPVVRSGAVRAYVSTSCPSSRRRSVMFAPMRPSPTMPSFMSGGDELAALRADAVEQLLERVGELLHAFLLEGLGDVVVVDSCLREVVQQAARVVEAVLERERDLAVVLEGADRLLRH